MLASSGAVAGAIRALALCGLCLFAFPRHASAEWHFTPMVGLTFKGDTSITQLEAGAPGNVHKQVGGSVMLLGEGIVGVEGVGVFTPGFFQKDELINEANLVGSSKTFALMGNAVLTVPRKWTEYFLRPFVSGGLGMIYVSESDFENLLPVHSTVAGLNVGGGAVGFITARTGVRFDLRYYSSLHRSAPEGDPVSIGRVHISYMTFSIGLVLRR